MFNGSGSRSTLAEQVVCKLRIFLVNVFNEAIPLPLK